MRHTWLAHWVHDFQEDPVTQIKIHKFFVWFWLVNFIVALAVYIFGSDLWARASVLYLVLVSLNANFATDYDALSAAQASLHGVESREAAGRVAVRMAAVEAEVTRLKERNNGRAGAGPEA